MVLYNESDSLESLEESQLFPGTSTFFHKDVQVDQ